MQLRIWVNGKLCSLGKHRWNCAGDDKLADYLTRRHWPAREDPSREFEVLVATVEALAADRRLKHFAIREMHPARAFVTSEQRSVLRELHRRYLDQGGHMWPSHGRIGQNAVGHPWLDAELVLEADSGNLEE